MNTIKNSYALIYLIALFFLSEATISAKPQFLKIWNSTDPKQKLWVAKTHDENAFKERTLHFDNVDRAIENKWDTATPTFIYVTTKDPDTAFSLIPVVGYKVAANKNILLESYLEKEDKKLIFKFGPARLQTAGKLAFVKYFPRIGDKDITILGFKEYEPLSYLRFKNNPITQMIAAMLTFKSDKFTPERRLFTFPVTQNNFLQAYNNAKSPSIEIATNQLRRVHNQKDSTFIFNPYDLLSIPANKEKDLNKELLQKIANYLHEYFKDKQNLQKSIYAIMEKISQALFNQGLS